MLDSRNKYVCSFHPPSEEIAPPQVPPPPRYLENPGMSPTAAKFLVTSDFCIVKDVTKKVVADINYVNLLKYIVQVQLFFWYRYFSLVIENVTSVNDVLNNLRICNAANIISYT